MGNETEYQAALIVQSAFPTKRVKLEPGMGLFANQHVWAIVTEANEKIDAEHVPEGTRVGQICWQGEDILTHELDETYVTD
ncbi:hypothetical protein [Halocatena pleomorpha]|uniref:Uncharacterized protein n=1 Tax=Halocatena pleomorpha TaxID=1785090 RepID=A0A3P3R4T6_9EURY|nr:hypothetical protein [Halocatena pleomorpha]RRJ28501.1 hypothetical protein EIK79_15510 [Halocatena pleomorpha]